MNISSTATSTSLASLFNISQATQASDTDASSATDTSGTQATGGHHHHHGGGAKALLDALEQTLSQLGLTSAAGTTGATAATTPAATTTSDAAAAGSSSAVDATGSSQDPATALRAFMHALFQAAQADGGGSDGSGAVSQTSATGGQAYGDMSSKLQDVLQN